MTRSDKSNVDILPNVALEPLNRDDEYRVLPGDLAVEVYKKFWPTPQLIRSHLTDQQWIEYRQYLVCKRCRRPCGGTCSLSG